MQARLFLTALLTIITMAASLSAQSFEGAFSGAEIRIRGNDEATQDAAVDVSWEAVARLGTLLNEPVVSLQFKYSVIAGIVTLPQLTETGRTYTTIRYRQLPAQLQAGVRLIDVKLRLTFSNGLNQASVVTDVGAPGRPGEWSFNVPGSPNWDKLFQTKTLLGYLGEEAAKDMMASDLTLVSATIESATLSVYQLHETYMRSYNEREEYRVLGVAYARLLEGLERSYGIDASSVEPGWSDAYFYVERYDPLDSSQDWFARLQAFDETLRKLMSLPAALRSGTNHGPYDKAVEDAGRLRRAATDGTYNFVPEGIDPANLEQGYKVPFAPTAPKLYLGEDSARLYEYSEHELQRLGRYEWEGRIVYNDMFVVEENHSRSCSFFNEYSGLQPFTRESLKFPDINCPEAKTRNWEEPRIHFETHGEVTTFIVVWDPDQQARIVRPENDPETDLVLASAVRAEGFKFVVRRKAKSGGYGGSGIGAPVETISTYYYDYDLHFLRQE